MVIQVTKEDINAAVAIRDDADQFYNVLKCCAMAQALKRQVPGFVDVGMSAFTYENGQGILPPAATYFIKAFDSGQDMDPMFFTFREDAE